MTFVIPCSWSSTSQKNIARDRLRKVYDVRQKPYFPFLKSCEWSKERVYCSELTYNVMKDVTGFELGRVQKMKEMKLDGPYVQALIQKRLTDIGKELDPDEYIVTPFSQMQDDEVTLIEAK